MWDGLAGDALWLYLDALCGVAAPVYTRHPLAWFTIYTHGHLDGIIAHELHYTLYKSARQCGDGRLVLCVAVVASIKWFNWTSVIYECEGHTRNARRPHLRARLNGVERVGFTTDRAQNERIRS